MEAFNSPQLVIALAFIVLMAVITVTAIFRYQAQDVLKILGVLTGLLGVILGSISTYYFTKPLKDQAENRANVAQQQLSEVQSKASDAQAKLDQIKPVLSNNTADLQKLLEQFEKDQPHQSAQTKKVLQNDLAKKTELIQSIDSVQKDLTAVWRSAPMLEQSVPPK